MVAAPGLYSSSPDPRFPNLRPEVVAGYLGAPATVVAEVIDGELSLMPRPRPQHAHAASRLMRRLGGFHDPTGDEPGGWVILGEPELHLGASPDVVVPDLAGWHRERFPANALDEDAPGAIAVAPDWCCEVNRSCSRSPRSVPVSGSASISVSLRARIAATTSSALPAQWRYSVALLAPARSATASMVMRSYPTV